jgi:pilus assembly protein CpaC
MILLRRIAHLGLVLALLPLASASAQTDPNEIIHVDLPIGRSYPVTTPTAITRISVANPEVADVVVVGQRDLVINGKGGGETDLIVWITEAPRRHYRVQVRSAGDRRMVLLSVKIAEVRRDVLHELGVNGYFRSQSSSNDTRAGTGLFRTDNAFNPDGSIDVPSDTRFLTILSDLGTSEFLAFIDAQEQRGNARLLAEPNLLAADRDSASFLAGGELPIPVVQPGTGGQSTVTIQYREFGVRLAFVPEIVNDSIIKLHVRPEVSSLDYANALLIEGFRIPALRTRRVNSTVDVKRDQSLVISGLMNEERERVRTGIPLLSNIPILGALFSSTRWQTNESELLIVVTPAIMDANRPRGDRVLPLQPDSASGLPANGAIEKRLTVPASPPARQP